MLSLVCVAASVFTGAEERCGNVKSTVKFTFQKHEAWDGAMEQIFSNWQLKLIEDRYE
jgi:hypothetical protein